MIVSAELLAFVLTLASGAIGRELWINLVLVSLFIQWIVLGNICGALLMPSQTQALRSIDGGHQLLWP
ncbi:MAG: hypothetical protein M3120_02775 [Pseudomonadota bacterium]|nr:hypothetical protein [Pseudomonadota bacterium]